MDANIVRDKTSDVTRVEHIFSDALLGRVNEKGEYVISEAIVKELIDNTKYFQKKINNKIYLYTFLESVERPYMMLMEYKLTEDKKQVTIKYSLIEEEYMADGLTINSIVTQIAFSKYNFSSDVILRAFRDFHVLIKKDEESQERKYQKNTPVANNTIQYNNIVDEKAEDNFDNFYEKAFVHIYQFLDNKKSSLSEQILKEYNTGLALHKTFFENADGKPLTNKVKFEILNNAIEKVTMTQPSSPEIQELKDAKQVALDGFVDQVKMTESKVIKDVMETADIATKGKILSVVANNVVAEKTNKNDVIQEIAEKEEDKGKTVSLESLGIQQEKLSSFSDLYIDKTQKVENTIESAQKEQNTIKFDTAPKVENEAKTITSENQFESPIATSFVQDNEDIILDTKNEQQTTALSTGTSESKLNTKTENVTKNVDKISSTKEYIKSKIDEEHINDEYKKALKIKEKLDMPTVSLNPTFNVSEINYKFTKFQQKVDESQRSESNETIGEIIIDEEKRENSEKVDER